MTNEKNGAGSARSTTDNAAAPDVAAAGIVRGFTRRAADKWRNANTVPLSGRVVAVRAGQIIAKIPSAKIGVCLVIERVGKPLLAEIVAFDEAECVLLPYDQIDGVEPGATVTETPIGVLAPASADVLGRVIDALGNDLSSGESLASAGSALRAAPPSPLDRAPIDHQLSTGVRVIDGLLPFGVGQRVGLFAGSGVGKSTLLAQLTRGTECDVCIVGLIGERGREVGEFLREALDDESRARTTIVVATSDAPPSLRIRAAEMATALAEQWRDQGKQVLLLVDSVTRYARAKREAALAAGEPPARRGYPASVFSALPRLLERAGNGSEGSISAVYTVLVEGGDMEEPIADEVRGIVDGHWILQRSLAEKGHFPAVDVLSSVSRVATKITGAELIAAANKVRGAMSVLHKNRDAIDLGIYQPGSNERLDRALEVEAVLEEFLRQGADEHSEHYRTIGQLFEIADSLG